MGSTVDQEDERGGGGSCHKEEGQGSEGSVLGEPKGSIGFLEKILQGPTSRTPGTLVVSDHMALVSV